MDSLPEIRSRAASPSVMSLLYRRAILLEYLTVAWMTAEAAVGIAAGVRASSIALVGFGLDSLMELAAGVALLWRLRQRSSGESRAERRAARIVAATFFGLGAYVGVESVCDLALKRPAEFSRVGIGMAAVALVAMPLLARAKRRVGEGLRSRALVAESMETLFCGWFSAALVAGLLLNGWLGWWWADPAAALAMAVMMVIEGREALAGGGS